MLRSPIANNLATCVRVDAAVADSQTAARVAEVTMPIVLFREEPPAVQVALVWRVLDLSAAAEQRAHVIFGRATSTSATSSSCSFVGANIPAALVSLLVLFPYGFRHPDAPIIAQLTERYPTLVQSLQVLKIANNDHDESAHLGAFAALATHLTKLSFYCFGFRSVGALYARCEYLRAVELCGCQNLSSVEGIEYHLYLEEFDASDSAITSIAPLRLCPALTVVSVSCCEALTSLAGIEGHPSLKVVDVSWSGVTSLEPLRTCPALKKVNLQLCRQLSSLEGLEGHQRLEVVDASDTPITSIEPLRTCPALAKVILRKCPQLPADVDLPVSGVEVIRT